MNLDQTKFIVKNVVAFCVGGTVISLVKQNVHPHSKLKKTETAIGATAMGLMLSDHVGTYTDRWIDAIVQGVEEKKDPVVLVH